MPNELLQSTFSILAITPRHGVEPNPKVYGLVCNNCCEVTAPHGHLIFCFVLSCVIS